MKTSSKYILTLLAICIINLMPVYAQQDAWTSDTLDNGKLIVRYHFNHYTDINGNDSIIIEDEITLTENISFNKCIELMKDISMHKEFSGDKNSKKVKDISDSECIVYYYTKNPWPIKNSDVVAIMKSIIDKDKRLAVFSLTAAPEEYEPGDASRMTQYNVSYTFQELPDGMVKITINGKTSPPVKVPFWMIKSAFPGTPAKSIRKIAELTKN